MSRIYFITVTSMSTASRALLGPRWDVRIWRPESTTVRDVGNSGLKRGCCPTGCHRKRLGDRSSYGGYNPSPSQLRADNSDPPSGSHMIARMSSIKNIRSSVRQTKRAGR